MFLELYLFLLLGDGKFACCYCEGKKEEFSGLLRTVQSLHDWYLKHVEDAQQYKNMQIYKNVVGPCLLQENPKTLIIDIEPPPNTLIIDIVPPPDTLIIDIVPLPFI